MTVTVTLSGWRSGLVGGGVGGGGRLGAVASTALIVYFHVLLLVEYTVIKHLSLSWPVWSLKKDMFLFCAVLFTFSGDGINPESWTKLPEFNGYSIVNRLPGTRL